MVFRKESKADAFQRQISALRQQLGGADEADRDDQADEADAARYDQTPALVESGRTTAYEDEAEAPTGASTGRDDSGYGFGSFGAATHARPFEVAAEPSAVAQMPEAPDLPATPGEAGASVIAGDASWKGDFQSDGSLHVHGRVEGTLRAREGIFVAEAAAVDATIMAATVVIAGRVQGTVRCDVRFEVLPQGRVSGEVQSPTLVIHEGAVMNAQVRMGPPEAAEQAPSPVVHRRSAGGRG